MEATSTFWIIASMLFLMVRKPGIHPDRAERIPRRNSASAPVPAMATKKLTASLHSPISAKRLPPGRSDPSQRIETSKASFASRRLTRYSSAHSKARTEISGSDVVWSRRWGLTRICMSSWARTILDRLSPPRGTLNTRSVRLQLAPPRRAEPASMVHAPCANPSFRPWTSSGKTLDLNRVIQLIAHR